MLSSRPKHPDELRAKLRRKAADSKSASKYTFEALSRDLGSVVTDLAGCRVVVYTVGDEDAVGAMLPRIFAQPSRADAKVETRRELDNPYRATHALVHPYGIDDVAEASVEGAICEVQIVTVAAHLLNEIEHDIGYKDRDGLRVDADEQQLLAEIRGVARVADRLVTSLLDHRAARRATPTAVIADAEDFKFWLRRAAGRRIDGVEIRRLFGLLEQSLEAVTSDSLSELGPVDDILQVGRELLGATAADYDEIAHYAAGIVPKLGAQEVRMAIARWRGPRTALRRALETAVRRHTQEEPDG